MRAETIDWVERTCNAPSAQSGSVAPLEAEAHVLRPTLQHLRSSCEHCIDHLERTALCLQRKASTVCCHGRRQAQYVAGRHHREGDQGRRAWPPSQRCNFNGHRQRAWPQGWRPQSRRQETATQTGSKATSQRADAAASEEKARVRSDAGHWAATRLARAILPYISCVVHLGLNSRSAA